MILKIKQKGGKNQMEEDFLIKKFTCERCGHTWIPRTEIIPETCPKCRSPYWNRPREIPSNQENGKP